jgi:excisionase family DNA binding protein
MAIASTESVGPAAKLQLVTKQEAAKLLACSCRMVERLVASGALAKVKIRGAVRFRLTDIERIVVKGEA